MLVFHGSSQSMTRMGTVMGHVTATKGWRFSFEDLLELLKKEDEEEQEEYDNNNRGVVRELTNRIKELVKYLSVLNGLFLDPAELYRMYQMLLSAVDTKRRKDTRDSSTLSDNIRHNIAKAVYDGMIVEFEGNKAYV